VFLLGIWKDYDELEASLSMPELFATLEASRDRIHSDRKFFAALQGVDLDDNVEEKPKQRTWEDIKATAFSGGLAKDANDILALSGKNAEMKGFGIGNGLGYAQGDESRWWER
jgi:hypothetical protein